MDMKTILLKELIKNGHENFGSNRVWDIASRKFLYINEEMAKGFMGLRNFDRYKTHILGTEVSLIKKNANILSDTLAKESFNLIDICCGDGSKAVEFIKSLNSEVKIRYVPINSCDYLTNLAVKNVKKANLKNVVEYKPIISDCDGSTLNKLTKELKLSPFKKNAVLLLGSILASYEINDYLFQLSKDMNKGDFLLIGNGVRKGERLVSLKTYKEDIFNKWFFGLIKYLGFNEEEVEYDARFANDRIEMFYKIKIDKTVNSENLKVDFKKGDEILTATLYKYYSEEFEKFCKLYFSDLEIKEDKTGGYALVFCKK
jgi:uncharacterized SAM-dependent methyltransferase